VEGAEDVSVKKLGSPFEVLEGSLCVFYSCGRRVEVKALVLREACSCLSSFIDLTTNIIDFFPLLNSPLRDPS